LNSYNRPDRTSLHRLLTAYNGHLVLCDPEGKTRDERKAAIWRGWQYHRPAADVVFQHTGLLGLIPWSIRTTVVDVDSGDPRLLPVPIAAIATPGGGEHLVYEDSASRGNSKFELPGVEGDIRGGRGYAVLWDSKKLVDALDEYTWDNSRSFQLSLFPSLAPVERGASRCPPSPEDVAADLSGVRVGRRNQSLFDATRAWAYGEKQGNSLQAWKDRVQAFAASSNDTMVRPLDPPEVRKLAYSVSSWCWSKMRPYAVGGFASGASRRKRTAARDLAIVKAHLEGRGIRSLAREYELSVSTVHNVLRRDGGVR